MKTYSVLVACSNCGAIVGARVPVGKPIPWRKVAFAPYILPAKCPVCECNNTLEDQISHDAARRLRPVAMVDVEPPNVRILPAKVGKSPLVVSREHYDSSHGAFIGKPEPTWDDVTHTWREAGWEASNV
jgi:hypothetical protein